jgi:hypothetical protein
LIRLLVRRLVDPQHSDVLEQHFVDQIVLASANPPGQHDVHAIAWEHEAGHADNVVDADGDGAHAILDLAREGRPAAEARDLALRNGFVLSDGYEPVAWGSERDSRRILERIGAVDVVVVEDALDMDQVEPLRRVLDMPWVGVTPEQLQRRLFSRTLSRKLPNGPLARQEVVRRAFGSIPPDVHALDAACLVLWWLAGSAMATGAPDLGTLKVWDLFTIADEFGEETYQIVPPNTADPSQGLISWASPLVQAVKGAKPGESITVQAPGGAWEAKLVRIEPRELG